MTVKDAGASEADNKHAKSGGVMQRLSRAVRHDQTRRWPIVRLFGTVLRSRNRATAAVGEGR